ncbi:MAG TPA: hypothetical protein VII78_12930 [Myxococcota bacterium]|jgi:hypothetical protein
MTERDPERRLRDAFARLRADEAARAPTLAPLLERARELAAPQRASAAWLRVALPLAGAAAASLAWWILASAPAPDAARSRARALRAELRPIALGSLRSPTDGLLASPLPALPSGFSQSLIPAPRVSPTAPRGEHSSQAAPARRFSA